MQLFRNILGVLAAILWLPVSAHCQLEKIPALQFLACAADNDSAGKHSNCNDAGCCLAEKAQYKSNQIRITIPAPVLLALQSESLADGAKTATSEVKAPVFTVAPPELPQRWQFVFRTASPPRAPSFAS